MASSSSLPFLQQRLHIYPTDVTKQANCKLPNNVETNLKYKMGYNEIFSTIRNEVAYEKPGCFCGE